MCGRVAFRVLKKVFTERFGAGRIDLDAVFPRANVTPANLVAGVRLEDGQRVATPYTWGFLPPNAPDLSFISKYFTFNAAAETLLEKRLWPGPFKTRRCLIVVSAWYEWPKAPGAKKGTPCTITPATDELFVFAGLWGPWKDPETGQGRDTASIITTAPNATIADLPHHRMPVVLGEEAWGAWLDPGTPIPQLQDLLRPCPDEWLKVRPGGPESFQVEA
jgi:putative SOS response-associated peptidase YedK